MPTLDDLDAICTYLEDQQAWSQSLYHSPLGVVKPRATRRGPVIWIVKDGKAVEFNQKEEKR